MGSIAFSEEPEHIWQKAGWALRQVFDDTLSQHLEDSELAEKFDRAKEIDGLMVYLLPTDLRVKVTNAIREAVTGILSGTIQSGVNERHRGDQRAITEYLEALQELLDAIPIDGRYATTKITRPPR